MDDSVKIKYSGAEEKISDIRNAATEMENIFSKFTTNIESVEGDRALIGHAGDAIRTKFDEWSPEFNRYVEKIREFANAIETNISAHNETDEAVANSANNL